MATQKQLTELKRFRSPMRMVVTKTISLIDELLESKTLEKDKLRCMLKVLQSKAEVLTVKDNEISSVMMELGLSSVEISDEIDAVEKYNTDIVYKIEHIHNVLGDQKQKSKSVSSSETSKSSKSRKKGIELPKIHLPTFDGHTLKWPNFWEMFCATIDDNEELPEVQKFSYLRGQLRENALLAIEGFSLTAANYEQAKEILVRRYGNEELQIQTHIKNLITLEIPKSTDHRNLRRFLDQLEVNVRGLTALNVTDEKYACFLIPLLESKLPGTLRMEWNRKTEEDRKSVTQIMEFLTKEVMVRERSFQDDLPQKTDKYSRDNFKRSAASLNVNVKSQSSGNENWKGSTRTCTYCDREHRIYECDQFKKLPLQERFTFVKQKRLCFNCLSIGHAAKQCKSRRTCQRCKGTHNTLIHYDGQSQGAGSSAVGNQAAQHAQKGASFKEAYRSKQSDQNQASNASSYQEQRPDGNAYLSHAGGNSSFAGLINHGPGEDTTMLKITTGIGVGRNGEQLYVGILLDGGSNHSYVTSRAARILKLPIVNAVYESVNSFERGISGGIKRTDIVQIHLKNARFPSKCINLVARVVDKISDPISVTSYDEEAKKWSHLQNIPFERDDRNEFVIDVLLGSDYYWDIIEDIIRGPPKSPTALKTLFGWVLHGPTKDSEQSRTRSNCFLTVTNPERKSLNHMLQRFWDLESFGIKAGDLEEQTPDQFDVQFTHCISKNDETKRYSVKLPWKGEERPPNNYRQAYGRYKQLMGKLNRQPEIHVQYESQIEELKSENILEEVNSQGELEVTGYYLPHFDVIKTNRETTKLRVVYDGAASKETKQSINDYLETGPAIGEEVLDVLLRFRQNDIGLCADVQKAFLMIEIDEEDRKFLRIIWKGKIYRLTRVPFGLNCSPYILNKVIRHHATKELDDDQAVDALTKHMYVDDFVKSIPPCQKASEVAKDMISLFAKAGMKLQKWVSNDIEFHKQLPEDYLSKEDKIHQVLGVPWDLTVDELSINVPTILENKCITKRTMLRQAASLFDIMGLISPYVVKVKILLQKAWKLKLDWDEELPSDLCLEYLKWKCQLEDIKNFRVPRSCFGIDYLKCEESAQMHIFCDASTVAYAASIYVRTKKLDRQAVTGLLTSKSRVAPVQTQTIPRLELLAAVLGSRLSQKVKSAIPGEWKFFYWSDSKIVLNWIKGNVEKHKVFEKNRLKEITTLTKTSQWHYCPSSDNPADLPSRGANLVDLQQDLWLLGPDWLKTDERLENMLLEQRTTLLEENREDVMLLVSTVVEDCQRDKQDDIEDILSKFSTWHQAKHCIGWISRFTSNCRSPENDKIKDSTLSFAELKNAEKLIVKSVQQKYFDVEIHDLHQYGKVKKTSKICQLDPFLNDEDIVCIKGRLPMELVEHHPIILPKNTIAGRLLSNDAHEILLHAGVEQTLSHLRRKYWIVHARQEIKRMKRHCVTCNKVEGKPYNQVAPALPDGRITECVPFNVTGLDHFGPLYASDYEEKLYVALFTCATVRAVHLELTHSLNAYHTRMAIIRFIGRRGTPSIIYSDNAKTFKVMAKDASSRKLFDDREIDWRFIASRAPWWGGMWERMVRSVKNSCKKTIGKRVFTVVELQTLMVQVEGIINSRPLTVNSLDIDDCEALTPSHFLIGKAITSISCSVKVTDVHCTNLGVNYKKRVQVLRQLWARFRREYLFNLRQLVAKHKPLGEPKIDELVIIHDNTPRLNWKLGRIIKLNPGKDGLVRSVELKTARGILNRPIQRIIPLEGHVHPKDVKTGSAELPSNARHRPRSPVEAEQMIITDDIEIRNTHLPEAHVNRQHDEEHPAETPVDHTGVTRYGRHVRDPFGKDSIYHRY